MTHGLLHDLLDARLPGDADRIALRRGDRTWTYGDVWRHSHAYAAAFAAHGVGRGDRVLVTAAHEPEVVAAVFAASRLGAIHVVVGEAIPPNRLAQFVADCQPRLLLGSAPPPVAGVRTVTFADLPATGQAPPGPAVPVDPVSLTYTSGSTSEPKAVVSTHRQVRFVTDAIQSRLCYRPTDTVFCCLPLSFDYGLYQVLIAFRAGAGVVLADETDAGPTLLRRLEEHGATVFPLVPSLAVTLTSLIRRAGRPPSRLRMITNTGATLPTATANTLRDLVPGLDLVVMFGLTECKRVSIMAPNGDVERPGSVGRPLPETEVLIVDGAGRRLPPGEIGELVVRGEHVMAGYWRSPALTAEKFRRDEFGTPLLHTGDRGMVDEDGYLYFAGRHDDIYKQRGFRVSATEVEAAAHAIPSVEQAVVLLPTGERGAVLVVTGDTTPNEVLRDLRQHLEEFKCPPRCQVVYSLPVGPNGKVDRKSLASAGTTATNGRPG